MATLFCLGDLRLEHDGATHLHGRRKPLALLAFLVRRRDRPTPREELADLLWGATNEANARQSLRQSFSELRTVLGAALVDTTQGVLVNDVASDVQLFEDATAAERWSTAVDLWKGNFIPDGEGLGSDAWRSWLEGERATLRRRLSIAYHRLAGTAEDRGSWGDVVRVSERWRSCLPDDPRAWGQEIHSLHSAGRLADAIARHDEGVRHFSETLDLPVPDEISRLGRALTRLASTAGLPVARLMTPDLVGRGEVMQLLAQARMLAASPAATRGRTVTVLGAEGAGKSRLLREFARQSRDRGAVVVESVALPSETARPFAMCRNIVAALASHSALAGCPPEMLATLAHIAPELREHFRHLPAAEPFGASRLATAMTRALSEVASSTPLVLAIDDVASTDPESLAVLASIISRPPAGVMVVATGRREACHGTPAVEKLLQAIDPGGQLTLPPLSVPDVRAMFVSMAPIATADLEHLVDDYHRRAGGNPGMLTSLLTNAVVSGQLVTGESGEWRLKPSATGALPSPADISDRWRARYDAFPAGVRTALDALATLEGTSETGTAPLSVWERTSGLSPVDFRAALNALQEAELVVVSDHHVRFAATIHRSVTLDAMAPSTRSALHARAARALGVAFPSTQRRREATRHREAAGLARSPRPLVAGAALGLLAMVAFTGWYVTRDEGMVRAGSPVVLADVENLTGDTTFDRTLQLAASVALQQSRQVSVFPRPRVREALALMQRPGAADSSFDEALAREVAVRESIPRVVALGIGRVDDAFVVTGRLVEPASGRDLFSTTERASTRAAVLDALDRVVQRLRRATGEPGDSVRQHAVPLPRLTTRSLAALEAYAHGLAAANRRNAPDARSAFRRAIELDSAFAMAWMSLAELQLISYNDRPSAEKSLARAYTLSDRLSERESLRLGLAIANVRGSLDARVNASGRLAARYPDRDTWHNHGTALLSARRCPEAIAAFERALAFDSSFPYAHINVATCQQFLGSFEAAIRSYVLAWEADSTSLYRGSINHEYGVALVRAGLVDSARRVYARMARGAATQNQQFGYRSLGYLHAFEGRYHAAAAAFDTAAVRARTVGTALSVFRNLVLQSEHLATLGDVARSREALDSVIAIGRTIPLQPYFALAAGLAHDRAGDRVRAREMVDVISKEATPDAPTAITARAILLARMALSQGNAGRAREVLRAATDTTLLDRTLVVLADTYLALGQRDSAYVTLQRVAERSPFGTDGQESWWRAVVRLGQLAEGLGLPGEARLAYTRIASLGRAGDDDLLPLREARLGLARLDRGDVR